MEHVFGSVRERHLDAVQIERESLAQPIAVDVLRKSQVGAERVASRLAAALGTPVRVAFPPEEFKDVRDFSTGRRSDGV